MTARPVLDTYPGALADFGLAIAVVGVTAILIIVAISLYRLDARFRRHVLTTRHNTIPGNAGKRVTEGRHIAISDPPPAPLEEWERALMSNDTEIGLSMTSAYAGALENETTYAPAYTPASSELETWADEHDLRHYVGDACPGGHEGTAEAFGLREGDPGPARG